MIPRGAQVTMPWRNGRVLLGDVLRTLPDGTLVVRHLNGEPWPVEPKEADVEVLERTYDEEENR